MRLRPLLALALAGALVFGGFQALGVARAGVEPERSAGAMLVPRDGTLTFRLRSADREVKALVDDRRVPARLSEGLLEVRPGRLGAGRHVVRISARADGLLRRTVEGSWRFTVDPRPPRLSVRVPGAVRSRQVELRGTTEAGAALALAHGEQRLRERAGPDGRFSFTIALGPGVNRLQLASRDAAGNRTQVVRRVLRDSVAPALQVRADRVWRSDFGSVATKVEDAGPARLTVRVDDIDVHSAEVGAGSREVAVGPLVEGSHRVEVTATDEAGNARRREQTIIVDSTETLGSATVGVGAQGRDVRQLLTLMRRFGGYRGRAGNTFDAGADRVLRAFQARSRLEVDGLAGPAVLMALTRRLPARVAIDRSDFTLTLIRGDVRVKTYTVAVGQARYPTPTGSLSVGRKERDPTWNPPNAPWAAELDTVPPGPGNPLGTRWIGLSIPSIGIHGTYATSSLGTNASHGCIRMSIPDVEELFEQLDVGTPVRITA